MITDRRAFLRRTAAASAAVVLPTYPLHSAQAQTATPVRSDLPPPLLGQHTAEVLHDWLNAPTERWSELQQRGIV